MKLRLLLALTVLPLVPARANISGFGDGTGFTLNQGQTSAAGPSITSGVATLTSNVKYQGNSIFFSTKQSVTAFNVSFTYQDKGASGTSNATADGFTFALQNDSRGASAVGYDGNALGYAGGTSTDTQTTQKAVGSVTGSNSVYSAAVEFNVYSSSTTGLGTAGALTLSNVTGTSTTGVLLYSGHAIDVTLAYAGTTLTETLYDQTTKVQTSFSYTGVNLSTTLGASTAYVGFTGATGATLSNQVISNFSYTVVPEPSTWAAGGLTALAGAAIVRRRLRRAAATASE